MPKVMQRRVQRHYSPLTSRSAFKTEPLLTGIILTSKKTFPFSRISASAEYLDPQREGRDQAKTSTSGPSDSQTLIKKPPGEVCRISRGGYNLEDTLGWPKPEYSAIQRGIRELAKKHLDMTSILSEQDERKLRRVFSLAKERFPILMKYQGDWVAEDFLSTMLKNSADRVKRLVSRNSTEFQANARKVKFAQQGKARAAVDFTTNHSANSSDGSEEESNYESEDV